MPFATLKRLLCGLYPIQSTDVYQRLDTISNYRVELNHNSIKFTPFNRSRYYYLYTGFFTTTVSSPARSRIEPTIKRYFDTPEQALTFIENKIVEKNGTRPKKIISDSGYYLLKSHHGDVIVSRDNINKPNSNYLKEKWSDDPSKILFIINNQNKPAVYSQYAREQYHLITPPPLSSIPLSVKRFLL